MTALVSCIVHDWGSVAKAGTLVFVAVGSVFVGVMMVDDVKRHRRDR